MSELAAPSIRDWDYPRGTASVLLMHQFAAERGAELPGVPVAELRAPDRQLDARQELAVVRALLSAVGSGDDVALSLGCRYRVTTFGIFGFACISSPTMRDAMVFALRYLDLSFTFCIPHVELSDAGLGLVLDDSRVPADVARFLVLRDLSAIYTVMQDLLPGISLRQLEFTFQGSSYVESYRTAFGTVPFFGAAEHRATFEPDLLNRPLPQANEQTVALCAAQCDALVARRRARSGVPQLVRERLVRLGGADAGMDEIARQLTLSTRTLRRRLTEAGTGYRQLLDEVRQTLAEELLDTGALSVDDVALRLGYAEASSFIYAFKRWTGTTPAAYARRAQGKR
ncbi:AraC family transcriptional regulator [Amycolatopsis benzoatilytica]|uniref:AraC family transcriptional regulator n=1 Tax=Amycolatopsis benzoatilytica TaxID=346045 RepID=UPI0003614FEC|nr:AraC family transcriptional regulator [Amycolatopsis benzoatilytica]